MAVRAATILPSRRIVAFLDLDRALTELESIAVRQARIVSLRYFVGLSVPETRRPLRQLFIAVRRPEGYAHAF
jgi:hypothetical protein